MSTFKNLQKLANLVEKEKQKRLEKNAFAILGILDSLEKQGYSKSFREGFLKEASLQKNAINLRNMISTGVNFFKNIPNQVSGVGLGGIAGGIAGGLTGGIPGAIGGVMGGAGLGGMASGGGALKYAPLAALGTGLAAAGYGANKAGLLGQSKEVDDSGLYKDRNRLLSPLNNQTTGMIGGALLSSMLANQLGIGGVTGTLAPALGAVLGQEYLPKLMNKRYDSFGVGENRVPNMTAQYNRAGI
jgi:hypothetical protein